MLTVTSRTREIIVHHREERARLGWLMVLQSDPTFLLQMRTEREKAGWDVTGIYCDGTEGHVEGRKRKEKYLKGEKEVAG